MKYLTVTKLDLKVKDSIRTFLPGETLELDQNQAKNLLELNKIVSDSFWEDMPKNKPKNLHPLTIQKVKAIEKKALSIGWTKDQLWDISPHHKGHKRMGLISLLKQNHFIGEVTKSIH